MDAERRAPLLGREDAVKSQQIPSDGETPCWISALLTVMVVCGVVVRFGERAHTGKSQPFDCATKQRGGMGWFSALLIK